MTRFAALIGAVAVATAVLAVLGYLSLRHWEASAELVLRQQAREMATMAAEKIEMTILKAEEESLAGLQLLVLEPDFRPDRVEAWRAGTRLVDRLYLLDRRGRRLYPEPWTGGEAVAVEGLLAELSPGFWD